MEFLRKLGSRLGFGSRDEDEEKKRRSRARQTSRPSARSMVQTTRPQPSRSSQQPSQTFDTSQPLTKVPDVTQPPQKSDNQRRIEELRKEVEQDGRPEWRQRFNFDANSPYSRLQRLEDGRQEMYADSLDKDENRRVFGEQQNAAQAMFGAGAQLANTIQARGSELPETLIGAYHQARGNDEALRKSLDIQRDTRNRLYQGNDGLLGVGTIYDDANEVANLGVGDTSKRIGAGLLDTGSLGIGAAGKAVIQQGARHGIRSLARGEGGRQLGRMSASGAAGTSSYELATNRDVTPGSFATSAAIGGAFGPLAGVGLAGLGSGLSRAGSRATSRLSKADAPTIPGQLRKDRAAEAQASSGENIGSGIKSENLVKVREEADNINRPAYQRESAQAEVQRLEAELAEDSIQSAGLGNQVIDDTPAYQHRNNVENIIRQGDAELDEFINLNPNASRADLESAQRSIADQVSERIGRLESARYPDSPRVPDVTDPIALAKADSPTLNPVASTPSSTPMANFRDSVDGSALRKVVDDVDLQTSDAADAVQAGRLQSEAGVDAQGNPVMVNDAQAAQQLADLGIAPGRGSSPVGASEQAMAAGRAQDASAQVSRSEDLTYAPRTHEQFGRQLEDPEIAGTPTTREQVSLEQVRADANAKIGNMSDEEVLRTYSGADPKNLTSPDEAMIAARRLESLGTDDAINAAADLADAVSRRSSESALWLRASQTLFDDLPTEGRIKLFEKKFGHELNNEDRAHLDGILKAYESRRASAQNAIDERADIDAALMDGRIDRNDPTAVSQARARYEELQGVIDKEELTQGEFLREAVDFMGSKLPTEARIARTGQFGKSMMLSAPSGRVFDVMSTGSTAVGDIAGMNLSSLYGRGLNKATGRNVAADSFVRPSTLVKGARQGLSDLGRAFKNEESIRAQDIDRMRKGKGTVNRGDLKRDDSFVNRLTRTMVMFPDALTRGIRDAGVERVGMQRAKAAGLTGDAAKLSAEIYSQAPPAQVDRTATQVWRRTNHMHDNRFTNYLEGTRDKLKGLGREPWDQPGPVAKAVGGVIENAVLPFTRFAGGQVNRAATDKNIFYNGYKMAQHLHRRDFQSFADELGKATVNTAEVVAAGTILSEAGILTEEGADGQRWSGLYLNIGDRYIPVGILGAAAPNLIAGYHLNNAKHDYDNGDSAGEAVVNGLESAIAANIRNFGVTSTLGGSSAAQQLISNYTQADQRGDAEGRTGAVLDALGTTAGQYIPGLGRDINSFLDQSETLNPTGEQPDTRAEKFDPETGEDRFDRAGTALNRLKSGIPFLSQGLDRREGSVARDFVDRATRGSRETEHAGSEREHRQSVRERELELRREGVPTNDKAIRRSEELGEWDSAIQGREFELFKAQNDPNALQSDIHQAENRLERTNLESRGVYFSDNGNPDMIGVTESGDWDLAARTAQYELTRNEQAGRRDSMLEDGRKQVQRFELYGENDYEPQLVSAYENGTASTGGIGVTDWREMMDSDDPEAVELAESLWELDQQLLDAGLIDEPKYYWGKGGRRGSGGRGGGGSRMSTNIATLSSPGFTYSPIKVQQANMSAPQSAIPELEKVPNYDDSRLRKISVTRGGRR